MPNVHEMASAAPSHRDAFLKGMVRIPRENPSGHVGAAAWRREGGTPVIEYGSGTRPGGKAHAPAEHNALAAAILHLAGHPEDA